MAIVFWNARRADVDARQYAANLKKFHCALNSNKPTGFRYSLTYRVASLPWFRRTGEIYEDWYVLRNFAAMDALNKAAVNDDAKEAHRYLMVSAAAASGAAYQLTRGPARMDSLPVATWFAKPRHLTADELTASVKSRGAGIRCSLWTRAMALGATEHCLLTSEEVDLPVRYQVFRSKRALLWSPSMQGESVVSAT